MTIVKEEMVSKALDYMVQFPHPVAKARKGLTDEENAYERVRAKVYLEQTGTVGEREAATVLDARVIASKNAIAEAALTVDAHRARVKSSEMIIDLWRTENANARAAERVR